MKKIITLLTLVVSVSAMSFDKTKFDSMFNEKVEQYKGIEAVEVVRKTRLGVDVIETIYDG